MLCHESDGICLRAIFDYRECYFYAYYFYARMIGMDDIFS